MVILPRRTFAPSTSLIYVTIGTMLVVWTGVWYFVFRGGAEMTRTTQFWVVGFFLTGLALLAIGLLLGPLGRNANRAELPPPEAMPPTTALTPTTVAAVPGNGVVVTTAPAATTAATVPVVPTR